MSLGSVTVSDVNQSQGTFTETERQFLFIGLGSKNNGSIQFVDASTDLDDVLGVADSAIKTQVIAARNNGGENWVAVAMPRAEADDWQAAFDQAMEEDVVCEAVVVCDPVSTTNALDDMQTAAITALSAHGRRVFFIARSRVFATEESTQIGMEVVPDSWADFITEVTALQDGLSAYRVGLCAEVVAGFQGMIAGRLCNASVSIADSPMRVKTGSLVGFGTLPVDPNGVAYSRAHAKALNDERLTVPQTYSDYDGVYCSDGQMLDAEGGDYQVVENLRVVDAAARRVRVLAIARVADRQLNSTPISISAAEAYFMRPLDEMSQGVTLNNEYFPGAIEPPQDGDIVISWTSNTAVEIYLLVRPYNNPKQISVSIALDLSTL